jgi:hypothetical protein
VREGEGSRVVKFSLVWCGSKTLHSCQIQYSPQEKYKIKILKKIKARIANSPKKFTI